ncbi:MAG: YybS family protein [Candidatus Margulisbacteria bacterium]|nr:YybS family protein [Candidatus Margulisiibacteriota bacterium]
MILGYKKQADQVKYFQGIVITAAIFCLPSLITDLSWLHGLVPLPVFYYLICFGQKQGTTLVSIALLIAGGISAIFGTLSILLFSLTMLPLGFVFAKTIARHETANEAGLKGVIYLITIWTVLGTLYATISGTNPYTEALTSLDKTLEASYTLYSQSAEVPVETLQEIQSAFKQLRLLIARMFPALLLSSTFFTVWLNMLFGRWLLIKKSPSLSPWNDFKEWKLPEILVWVVILAVVQLLLPIESIKTLGLNTAFVLGVLYFFQGLSILSCLLAKWSVPQPFKVLIYLLVLIQVYGIILLSLIGIADIWANFRKKQPAAS